MQQPEAKQLLLNMSQQEITASDNKIVQPRQIIEVRRGGTPALDEKRVHEVDVTVPLMVSQ
jgi:hypothetical protein